MNLHEMSAHLRDEAKGEKSLLDTILHKAGAEAAEQVRAKIAEAKAKGFNWLQILMAILPIILSLFSGGKLDVQAIIDAINKLIAG